MMGEKEFTLIFDLKSTRAALVVSFRCEKSKTAKQRKQQNNIKQPNNMVNN